MRGCSADPTRPRGAKLVSILICVTAWGVMTPGTVWGGTIKGTVRFAGAAPEQQKLAVTVDQYVCGKGKEAEH